MFLTPDTTALLVADRRRAFESFARRRRRNRDQTPTTTVATATTPARPSAAPDRTSVAPTPKAA